MSTTDRYRPDSDTQYAKCKTCGLDLPTRQEVDIHLNATMAVAVGERGGHTIRILNPSCESRIENEVGDLIYDAISDAMSKPEDFVCRNHITEAGAKKAISQNSDFADAADAGDEHRNE